MMCQLLENSAEQFHSAKILCTPFNSTLPLALTTIDFFTVSIVLPSPECYSVGIIKNVAFSNDILSLNNTSMSFYG